MSIPVLIVPTLNQPVALAKMLRSIDHWINQIVIIDNGDVCTGRWREDMYGEHLLRITDQPIRVVSLPHNIGVGASWNLGIKVTPKAPWWLFVNDDLEFGPGDLARMEQAVDPGAGAVYFMFGMAAFGLTYHALQAAGFSDESIHPAYDEDLDWHRRMQLAGVITVETGFTGTHVGSATIMADPELRRMNGQTHTANDAYYARKWGGPKSGGETFQTPFDRGGHLGDWRVDISTLREQAWPRRK